MDTEQLLAKISEAENVLAEIRKIVTEEVVEMPPVSTPAEAERRAAAKLCVVCGKPLPPPKPGKKRSDDRGADHKCYKQVMRAVEAGVMTKEDAVAWGWLLPAKPGGRPRSPNSIAARAVMAAQLAKKSKP